MVTREGLFMIRFSIMYASKIINAMSTIKENIQRIFQELPSGVQLVVVGKGRSIPELFEAINGGAQIIGENYVQEAGLAYAAIVNKVQWHFIGHLQKNKVRKAVELFDMIETVDSLELARELNKRCALIGKTMPVLVEVNSAREENKTGAMPESAILLARDISGLANVNLMGLMTMGASSGNGDGCRQYFSLTRNLFEEIKQLNLPNTEMKYLSMGMTDSYRVALEEGANIVRIGTGIFGTQKSKVISQNHK
jgi:pyridoxal phosphate enzyme (YggS family)